VPCFFEAGSHARRLLRVNQVRELRLRPLKRWNLGIRLVPKIDEFLITWPSFLCFSLQSVGASKAPECQGADRFIQHNPKPLPVTTIQGSR
jgi:hypothetical protein